MQHQLFLTVIGIVTYYLQTYPTKRLAVTQQSLLLSLIKGYITFVTLNNGFILRNKASLSVTIILFKMLGKKKKYPSEKY